MANTIIIPEGTHLLGYNSIYIYSKQTKTLIQQQWPINFIEFVFFIYSCWAVSSFLGIFKAPTRTTQTNQIKMAITWVLILVNFFCVAWYISSSCSPIISYVSTPVGMFHLPCSNLHNFSKCWVTCPLLFCSLLFLPTFL